MEFVELTEPEFAKFSLDAPRSNFAQSVQFAKMREKLGWEIRYIGLKAGKIIKIGSIFAIKRVRLNYGDMYCGPLFDEVKWHEIKFFYTELKKYAKQQKLDYVTCNPTEIVKTLNWHGGTIRERDKDFLKEFMGTGFRKRYEITPHFVYVKNLAKIHSDDELMKSFGRAKYEVKKALSNCLAMRQITKRELPKWKEIMEKTAERQGFSDKSLAYYEAFYDEFTSGEPYLAEFVIVEANTKRLIKEYKKAESELRKELMSTIKPKDREQILDRLGGVQNRQRVIAGAKDDFVAVSAGLFVYSEYETVYLFSGNDPKFLKLNGVYLMLYDSMKKTISDDVEEFNFYGVTGNFNRENNDRYGALKFKQGFNGHIEEYLGGFIIVIHPLRYYMTRLIQLIQRYRADP